MELSTSNARLIKNAYTIVLRGKMLEGIVLQTNSGSRTYYKATPMENEVPLTDEVFKQAMYVVCKIDPTSFKTLYDILKEDEHWRTLSHDVIERVVEEYTEMAWDFS